jgi:hypothetical protein
MFEKIGATLGFPTTRYKSLIDIECLSQRNASLIGGFRCFPLEACQRATKQRKHAMSKKAAEHHKKAAEHATHAARHHTEAGKHHDAGHHEKAAHHAHTAHGHASHARHHAEEAARAHTEEHGKK